MIPRGSVGVLRKLLSLDFRGYLPIFIVPSCSSWGHPFPVFLPNLRCSQVSVLSVLCFALAINDIVTAVPNGVSCSLYVDDFVLYLSDLTLPSAVRRMQLAINRVAD